MHAYFVKKDARPMSTDVRNTTMTCTQCQKTRPAHDSGQCWECRRGPVAPPADTTPLIAALIAERHKAGFTPQTPDAVTMQQCVALTDAMGESIKREVDAHLQTYVQANVQRIELHREGAALAHDKHQAIAEARLALVGTDDPWAQAWRALNRAERCDRAFRDRAYFLTEAGRQAVQP